MRCIILVPIFCALFVALPSSATDAPKQHVILFVQKDGGVTWNGAPISEHLLREKLKDCAALDVHVRAAKTAKYESVAHVMRILRPTGCARIGIINFKDT